VVGGHEEKKELVWIGFVVGGRWIEQLSLDENEDSQVSSYRTCRQQNCQLSEKDPRIEGSSSYMEICGTDRERNPRTKGK
jgi:hypothetical protein